MKNLSSVEFVAIVYQALGGINTGTCGREVTFLLQK